MQFSPPFFSKSHSTSFQVSLTRAQLRIGAVYLNASVPISGAGATSCVLPGIYVAEAFGPATIDLLSPSLQQFPGTGEGTQNEAKTAEVWLNKECWNDHQQPPEPEPLRAGMI